jgi:hypothetical protein
MPTISTDIQRISLQIIARTKRAITAMGVRIRESLCGASIGADKILSFVRLLLEMALVPPEALGRRGVSHLAAFLAALPSKTLPLQLTLGAGSRS